MSQVANFKTMGSDRKSHQKLHMDQVMKRTQINKRLISNTGLSECME